MVGRLCGGLAVLPAAGPPRPSTRPWRAPCPPLRGMPEPGIVANAAGRPACSVAMVGGDPPDSKPFHGVHISLRELATTPPGRKQSLLTAVEPH
jgi:hypothetical protein